jgi:histidinol-phosphate aminotransferase
VNRKGSSVFSGERFIRGYVRDLAPYSTARDEFSGEASVFLDANENPFPSATNRYPDPHQVQLKARVSEIKGVSEENIFLGSGSDEAIELLIRVTTCNEGGVTIMPPTYGMYRVAARNNGVSVIEAPLNRDFSFNLDAIAQATSLGSPLLFVCSPNNPTGTGYSLEDIEAVLHRFCGIVVVDEAYIDFAQTQSATALLKAYDRLVVLQTFSKAWGLAGARLGIAFAAPALIEALNTLKLPYNISTLTQKYALQRLEAPEQVEQDVQTIVAERSRLQKELAALTGSESVFPSQANFLLVKVQKPREMFLALQERGVIVRDRSSERNCEGCLRITIGTPYENDFILSVFGEMFGS